MDDLRSTCRGGEYDGYKLATGGDEARCMQSGGEIIPGPKPSGGCAGGTVEEFSDPQGQPLNVTSLRNAGSIFNSTEEVALLRRLSAAVVPVTEAILTNEPGMAERIFAASRKLEAIAAKLLNSEFTDVLYTEEDHNTFVELGRDIAGHTTDRKFPDLLKAATQVAEGFQGVKAAEVRAKLGGLPDFNALPVTKTELHLTSPTGDFRIFKDTGWPVWRHHAIEEVFVKTDPNVVSVIKQYGRAKKAISAKAISLGSLATSQQGEITFISGGFVQKFADCDILYTDETGAHEINGDIRRKYWEVNGPTRLGFPTTDETVCLDGVGRYNHFVKSSIYWTPTTGPFYVKGVCRFRWGSDGWELGPLGYPVQDEEWFSARPTMYWSHFQNGIVFGRGPEAKVALSASVTRQQILDALRTSIDRKMPSMEVTVGLVSFSFRGGLYGVDFLGVDDWRYDFYGAIPRTLRVRVNGFVSVTLAPDPTFEIEMALQFSTRSPIESNFYPSSKKLVATLLSTRISVTGIESGTILNALKKGIWSAFAPGPADPEITDNSMVITTIPTGANQTPGAENLDLLDVMLMADGSLNIYVNPLPTLTGRFRKMAVEIGLETALRKL